MTNDDINAVLDEPAAEIDRQAANLARNMIAQAANEGCSPLVVVAAIVNAAANFYVMVNPPAEARAPFRAMFEEGMTKAMDLAEATLDRAGSGRPN